MVRSDLQVSFDDEQLVLVDDADREVGFASKERCHQGDGLLHRAFSVFLFDQEGRVLLQQRSPTKLLWPGFWANTCCSHPRRGETVALAASRRIEEELGLAADLEELFAFRYHARFGNLGSERELCRVLTGSLDGVPRPNPHEVAAVRLLTPAELDGELAASPSLYTPWLHLEWPRVRTAVRAATGTGTRHR